MGDIHECPQCGYCKTGKNPRDHIPLSATDNVSSVEDRVRLLDTEISSLNEERAQLLRKRNALASPIRKSLPPEILSSIFRFVCPPIDLVNRHFDTSELAERAQTPPSSDSPYTDINEAYVPVVLGSVCSFWRQVARATPELWTSIALEVREKTAASHARLLRMYITGSRAFRVSVELDFRKEQKAKQAIEPLEVRAQRLVDALRPIRNILFHQKATPKIGVLRLIAPPREWLPFIALFPRLENLALGWPYRFCLRPTDSDELDLSNLRHLTHVTLSRDLRMILPWSQITNLKLLYLPITTCLEILFRCENVQRCRVRYPYSDEPGLQLETLQGGPVILRNLRFLEWPPISAAPMLAFFSRLNLPSLRRLRWEGNGDLSGSGAKELALDFFKRLPTTMTTLELIGETFVTAHQRDTVRDLLCVIPQLEYLILNGIRSEVPLANILEALGSDDELAFAGRSLLPALRVLEFKNSQKCRLLPTFNLASRLINMLQGRYSRSDGDLSIKLDVQLNWSDEQKENLKHLIRKEFRIEIWEGGELVKWLH